MRRVIPVLALLMLAATSCTEPPAAGAQRDPTTTTVTTTTAPATTTTTEPPPPPCPVLVTAPPTGPEGPVVERIGGEDPVAAAIAVSRATFDCATDAVVVSDADPMRMALAARLAAGLGGPLLIVEPGTTAPTVTEEVARLTAQRLYLVGADALIPAPPGTKVEVLDGDPVVLAGEVSDHIGATGEAVVIDPGMGLVAATIAAIESDLPLLPPLAEALPTTPTTDEPASTTAETATTIGPTEPAAETPAEVVAGGDAAKGVVWLVDRARTDLALVTAASAAAGGFFALVDGADLRAVPEVGRALKGTTPGVVYLLGEVTEGASWQLPVLLTGDELPGGGYLMFPDRRLVAFYGHPSGSALGVLGEQGPEAGLDRLEPIAGQYSTEGVVVIPSWEIIATVADAKAGEDGDYSYETPIDDIRPWIDVARDNGMYVLIDLQPGRTDFLTQAKLYEELLLEPFVGLALDPEWRLKPNQVHLRQIGGVDAAEVNAVSDWLAGLVRDHHLPQKMLLLHQFQLSMLRDRDQIQTPSELAVVIQMDGQGPLHTKYETWAAITAGALDQGWWWGWKNFYDEDTPTATPSQVLDLEPVPVYVSYQ